MDRRISTFVDYENIRISLRENFLPKVAAKNIATAIKELAEEHGEWRGGTAYADWSKNKRDARCFEDAGFQPKMVLPKRGGTDRSDITMSLDIQEYLVEKSGEVDAIVIVSGDSDFQEVIRRAKDRGVWVLVVASAPNTAAGIVSVADQFVAIEARMGLKPRAEVEMEHPLPDRDWTMFVELLAGLEAANRYVGIKRLLDEWMASEPQRYGYSRSDRRTYIRDAEAEGIAAVHQVAVVLASGRSRQVSAVRLNREHPVVTAALSSLEADGEEGEQGEFVPQVDQAEADNEPCSRSGLGARVRARFLAGSRWPACASRLPHSFVRRARRRRGYDTQTTCDHPLALRDVACRHSGFELAMG